MQYPKKYFTEGLIQMAILLSLCGLMVDVGLEPYLPACWHERILGPTSALTQTQFHNLRNRLEDGHGLHPKNVDLDSFFTARRLLGWVHSLDRLQVPQAELETWLVQREHGPLPAGLPVQASSLAREPPGIERVQLAPSLESRPSPAALHEEADDEEESEERETYAVRCQDDGGEDGEDTLHQHDCFREGERPESFDGVGNSELNQNVEASSSLQECLRLLDERFPPEEEQQQHDTGGGRSELESREPLESNILHSTNLFLDLELHWQDLLGVLEPQHNIDSDTSSFDGTQNSGATERFQGPHQLHGSDVTQTDPVTRWQQGNSLQERRSVPLLGLKADPCLAPKWDLELCCSSWVDILNKGFVSLGSPGPPDQWEEQPALLPLTPTEELDDHRSAFSSGDAGFSPRQNPPDHMDLFAHDPSQEFCLGFSAEDDMNLLTQDLVDTLERSSHAENVLHSSYVTFQEGSAVTPDLLVSPSGDFLFGEDDVEDEDGLPSPLSELMEDAAILDEIRLLDLALEEGFSPEMAARLDEAGYLLPALAQQEPSTDDFQSQSAVRGDQVQPGDSQQDGEYDAGSDSGLSLDFSHSQASPSASEASSYCSSSPCSSSGSADESLFSDTQELCDGPHVEMEVTVKQEEEEEELGAVGGSYPGDAKQPFRQRFQEEKLLDRFPWLEHVDHDHTYNQSPSLPVGKMSTKQTRSSVRPLSAKPYRYSSSHPSDSKMWSHDERRARASKVPFSNELIVNLPVEEFNELLASFQLSEEQLLLIKDIRRRGKNKVAAQNCRKRKMDVLLGLNDEVSGLIRRRSRLLREKREAMRNLQEMKHRLKTLYQDVFSRLRDAEGRPLNPAETELHFQPDGSVSVASSRRGGATPQAKSGRKQANKKK